MPSLCRLRNIATVSSEKLDSKGKVLNKVSVPGERDVNSSHNGTNGVLAKYFQFQFLNNRSPVTHRGSACNCQTLVMQRREHFTIRRCVDHSP